MAAAVPATLRRVFEPPVRFLNNPAVKQNVKNVAGYASFAFGLFVIGDDIVTMARSWKKPANASPIPQEPVSLRKIASKIFIVICKISLFCSFMTSPPMIGLFGPKVIFAVNAYDPRHVINITAFVLGYPALVKSVIDLALPGKISFDKPYLIQTLTAINTLFSRTMLHTVNQLMLTRVVA